MQLARWWDGPCSLGSLPISTISLIRGGGGGGAGPYSSYGPAYFFLSAPNRGSYFMRSLCFYFVLLKRSVADRGGG